MLKMCARKKASKESPPEKYLLSLQMYRRIAVIDFSSPVRIRGRRKTCTTVLALIIRCCLAVGPQGQAAELEPICNLDKFRCESGGLTGRTHDLEPRNYLYSFIETTREDTKHAFEDMSFQGYVLWALKNFQVISEERVDTKLVNSGTRLVFLH